MEPLGGAVVAVLLLLPFGLDVVGQPNSRPQPWVVVSVGSGLSVADGGAVTDGLAEGDGATVLADGLADGEADGEAVLGAPLWLTVVPTGCAGVKSWVGVPFSAAPMYSAQIWVGRSPP